MSLSLIAMLVVFAATMAVGVPLTFAMLISCVAYLATSGQPLYLLVHKFFTGIDTFTLMAIPFFTLAGDLMVASGTAEKMLKFANVMVGRFRGGLGYVTVFSSMLFGGCSGSAISEVAGLGKMQAKMMEQAGYPREFGAALAIAASIQGAIIPPSIPMVLVGAVSGVSIGAMLIGGAIPGMLVGGAMAVVVFIQAGKLARGKEGASSWREIGEVTLEALPFLLMPVIILGGILIGVFTPTEASAVAAAYGFVLMAVRHRGHLPWIEFGRLLMRGGAMAAAVLMLSGASNVFSWILATEQLPRHIALFLGSISDSPLVILLIVNLFLLVWGMFMDMLPAIFIIVPILIPIGAQLGIDPVHFGVMITFNLVVGLITPPYGTALFTGAIVTGLPIETVVKSIWPFILSSLAILAVITYVPGIVLVLPHFFGLR
jgi:TRAP-type transport system large permease protein